MHAIIVIVLTVSLAQWANGARVLRGYTDQPLIAGAPQNLQETFEYGRLHLSDQDSLVQNRVQADTQQGKTQSLNTILTDTRNAGLYGSDARNALGQNQAQSVVSDAANGDSSSRAATKEHFGAIQYQVLGNGLRTTSETRTALASNDAQRQVMASLAANNAFIATLGNADGALATIQSASHKFTD